jgi:hypothetical protein
MPIPITSRRAGEHVCVQATISEVQVISFDINSSVKVDETVGAEGEEENV